MKAPIVHVCERKIKKKLEYNYKNRYRSKEFSEWMRGTEQLSFEQLSMTWELTSLTEWNETKFRNLTRNWKNRSVHVRTRQLLNGKNPKKKSTSVFRYFQSIFVCSSRKVGDSVVIRNLFEWPMLLLLWANIVQKKKKWWLWQHSKVQNFQQHIYFVVLECWFFSLMDDITQSREFNHLKASIYWKIKVE